jgi:hypothetical protein
MLYSTIDNFLEPEVFNPLVELLNGDKFPWNLYSNYLFHNVYRHGTTTEYWPLFEPIIDKLPNLNKLIRVKANLYHRTSVPTTLWWHKDMEQNHNGCVIGINTCNGGLSLGSKDNHITIPSVANQCIFFDPGTFHAATTCSDQFWRINININWI